MDFLPSKHGFHFSNSDWPDEPDFTIHVPLLGNIPVGNAANGMCGGMAFASLDYYLAGQAIPDLKTPPAPDDPLYKYIYGRLVDSFDIPFGVFKCYSWMSHLGGLMDRTKDEIKAIEDSDSPVPIYLIYVQSHNPLDLGKNHQVLAYGSSENGLRVYDNNYPDDDSITITCDGESIVHSAHGEIRGLFRANYLPKRLT